MTLGGRIKKIRQDKQLTQQELAKKIGTTQNSIARYETDTRTPPNAVISLICRTFHVNEKWLRNGEEPIYLPKKEELLLDDASLDNADRALLNSYIEAPPAMRAQIRKLLCRMADNLRESTEGKPAALTIDEKVAAYRAELEAEEKAKEKSLVSLNGGENAG